ncbi:MULTISPECIES: hypothetical protein [Komagataeibacter]|uniref:hypothetical protein n=1 Tax=Komagataeibacter TaxID=1434011 RepID=UPI001CD2A6A2|nr:MULTISPECIES: hypothetical protein [Komagataeibacter]
MFTLTLHVTPASRYDRAEVGRFAAAIQDATGESVEPSYLEMPLYSFKVHNTLWVSTLFSIVPFGSVFLFRQILSGHQKEK